MADTGGLLSHFYVKIDGADAPEALMHDLSKVSVDSSLHLPDVATLILHDTRLHWIDDGLLAPGKSIEISAKSGQTTGVLFDGEIVELEPDFTASTHQLTVRAFDRLHRLSRGRQVRSFLNVTDGDMMSKLASEVGLQAKLGPMNQVHAYAFQNNETNLDFLHSRAVSLGYLLFVKGKTLHCEEPTPQGAPLPLEWGVTLSEFRPRLTTINQIDGVMAGGWDPATKEAVTGDAHASPRSPHVGEPKTGAAMAQDAFHVPAKHLVADRPIRSKAMADQLAQAVADQTACTYIEADGLGSGNPLIVAGSAVTITALGNRFSGTYYVTAATHLYEAEHGYSTRISVSGHHPATLLSMLTPTPTTTPTGLVIGVVTDNQDPTGAGRVKVKYPWLSNDHASDWARVVAQGGGAQRGIEFLPEVNDEVLVGFEMGDIHYPYVLGGLWNGKDDPPKKSNQVVSGGKVQERIIRSRTGHIISFDDSDGGGGITIQDKNGNKVMLDSAANAMTVEIKGDVTVKATGALKLEAQGQVEIKGMGVKIDGGAATVDVKGSIINLN